MSDAPVSPWIGIVLALAGTGAVLALARFLQQRRGISPELSRKIVHIGGGLVASTFPWLFTDTWPVLVITLLSITSLQLLRATEMGSVLHGVRRASWGDLYFPITVGLLFVLARGDRLLYLVPLLVLTFADSVAALIGTRYGTIRFRSPGGPKSLQGSVAFFVVAFLCVAATIQLLRPMPVTHTILIAIQLGLLLMMVESAGWRGSDNLLVPLAGFFVFQGALETSTPELAVQCTVTLGLLVFLLGFKKDTKLSTSAILIAVLIGYLCWTIGGWRWLLAPLLLLAGYLVAFPPGFAQKFRVMTVACVCGPGVLWLLSARLFHQEGWIVPYTIAFAAQLAMIGSRYINRTRPALSPLRSSVLAIALGWTPFVLFFAYLVKPWMPWTKFAVLSLLAVTVAVIPLRALLVAGSRSESESRWIWQAAIGGTVSLAGVL